MKLQNARIRHLVVLTRARRQLAIAALSALGLLVAGCGASQSSSSGSSSSTTTTLPTAVAIGGSSPSGSMSFLGGILRIPVVALPNGSDIPPAPLPGSPNAANQVKIGFRQFGSGPDLLLVMGEHGTMTWWDPTLLRALSASYRVTIFDLPSVGYSGALHGMENVDAFADVTGGLIVALGLKDPVVLGWGMGGSVGLALAERHAGLASRLVLVEATAGGKGAVAPSAPVAVAFASPLATMDELSHFAYPPAAEKARLAWLGQLAELPPDDIVAAGVRKEANVVRTALQETDVEEGLARIAIPCLVIRSSADEVVPPGNSVPLLAGLRHARALELAGAGYAGLFQDDAQVVAALMTFTK